MKSYVKNYLKASSWISFSLLALSWSSHSTQSECNASLWSLLLDNGRILKAAGMPLTWPDEIGPV